MARILNESSCCYFKIAAYRIFQENSKRTVKYNVNILLNTFTCRETYPETYLNTYATKLCAKMKRFKYDRRGDFDIFFKVFSLENWGKEDQERHELRDCAACRAMPSWKLQLGAGKLYQPTFL